jgi:hypothetical protein
VHEGGRRPQRDERRGAAVSDGGRWGAHLGSGRTLASKNAANEPDLDLASLRLAVDLLESGAMPLNAIEKSINAITDADSNWWPFLWLRPHKHVPLSLERLCMIAGLYGVPLGTATSIAVALAYPSERAMAPIAALVFPMLLLFVATAIVGPMWNRRAHRLRRRLR